MTETAAQEQPRTGRAKHGQGRAASGSRRTHRDRILEAAERLFLSKGYNGTSIRDIAETAGVSLGNLYNHWHNKEALFRGLLAEYEAEYFAPGQPLPRAFREMPFPENIERIGEASRQSVDKFANYMKLIYVDMVEFDAEHISRMFQEMRRRYVTVLQGSSPEAEQALAPDIDPTAALMMVTWSFFNYFQMERLFKVKQLYGMDGTGVIEFFSRVFRRGITRQ